MLTRISATLTSLRTVGRRPRTPSPRMMSLWTSASHSHTSSLEVSHVTIVMNLLQTVIVLGVSLTYVLYTIRQESFIMHFQSMMLKCMFEHVYLRWNGITQHVYRCSKKADLTMSIASYVVLKLGWFPHISLASLSELKLVNYSTTYNIHFPLISVHAMPEFKSKYKLLLSMINFCYYNLLVS